MKKKRIFGNKVLCILVFGTAASLSLTGCQKSPEKSIVVNKDLDKLIEQAEETEKEEKDKTASVLVKEYDTYKTTIEDTALRVKVNVDAKVDIPETDKLSVFRVSQKKFTQELLDAVRKELMGDTALYNGSALKELTKLELEGSIALWKDEISEFEKNPDKNAKAIQEAKQYLAELEEAYNKAPTGVSFENKESDGKIQSISETYNANPKDEFYSWLYNLTSGDGETYYGVSDGSDGTYSELYVLNSENRSNYLSFTTGNHGYQFCTMYGFEPELNDIGAEVVPDIDETGSLKKPEAIEIADEFLKKVGINDDTNEFRYYEGGMKTEQISMEDNSVVEGKHTVTRKYYVLTYMRYLDGAFITAGGQGKINRAEQESGGVYTKKDWPQEKIEFRIDDSGIVGFNYTAPLQVTETIVEKSAMLPYEQVQKTFEKMILITNGNEEWDTQLDIDRVTLGYVMVSEPGSYDTGLLIPGWDFFGRSNMLAKGDDVYQGENAYRPLLTINAIDGSVIDRELGY